MRDAYLGVDAGNSKTVALIASSDGTVLGRGRAGTGDIYGLGGEGGAVREVVAAVRQAAGDAGIDLGDLRAAAFRLAGVDWPEDEEFWQRTLRSHLPELPSGSVRNDGFALLRLGGDGVGVSAIAGTGGAVAARGPDGAEASMSFWIQEEMGAAGLGAAALRAVVRADLGIDPPTALTAGLLGHYGAADVGDLLHSFTRRVDARPYWAHASASRLVLAAAADGDPAAGGIVRAQTARFADYAAAAARRVGLGPVQAFPVLLGGALATSGLPLFRDALVAATALVLPAARVEVVTTSPVVGAVLDALAEDGRAAAAQTVRRLQAASHPVDFLLT